AHALAYGKSAMVEQSHSGAVVTTVFQPVQPLHQHVHRAPLALSDVTDDPTHGIVPSDRARCVWRPGGAPNARIGSTQLCGSYQMSRARVNARIYRRVTHLRAR